MTKHTQTSIKAMQTRIGVQADGFWGPKSMAACQAHLRKLMPKPNPWPLSDQKSLTAFFGPPGDENRLTRLDVTGLELKYEGAAVASLLCHLAVSSSLKRVLTEISKSPHAWVLKHFEGCYNNRPMRGGSLPSLHARGAAIDFAASTNGLKTSWPVAASMPLEVMEMFAREGWLAAGAFWGRDAMHFQATR